MALFLGGPGREVTNFKVDSIREGLDRPQMAGYRNRIAWRPALKGKALIR